MVEYYSLTQGHSFEGTPILRYKIALPRFTDKARMTEFYGQIYDRVIGYCKDDLCRHSEEKYLQCDIPRKKFDYPPLIYRLEGRVTCIDGDLLFVKLTATVSQRGLSNTVTVYDAHAWSVSDECLIPPKAAAREYLKVRKAPRQMGKNGFLVENGKAFICLKDRLVPISLDK